MNSDENEALQTIFAECVYANSLSFNAMTGKMWTKFFKRIRPKFQLPSRDQLSNHLLDKSFDRISKLAIAHVDQSEFVSIVLDGWTNVRKDAIINIVAMTPTPVFVKSVDTKGETKDANYMYQLLVQVIEDIGANRITGLVSDNENKMIALANLIKDKYKHVIFNGCVAHKLNNLVKKICQLPTVAEMIANVELIVKEINNHQKLHAKFREMIASNSMLELKLYSQTRFAGTLLMIDSVIKSITVLRSICADPSNNVSTETKELVLGIGGRANFFNYMNSFHQKLWPICLMIHKIESDNCSIADMIEIICQFNEFNFDDWNTIDNNAINSVKKLVNDALISIITPSAVLANILHPNYRGVKINAKDKSAAQSMLLLIGRNLGFDKTQLVASYQQFINSEYYFSNPFIQAMDKKRPISWWKYIANTSTTNCWRKLLCVFCTFLQLTQQLSALFRDSNSFTGKNETD